MISSDISTVVPTDVEVALRPPLDKRKPWWRNIFSLHRMMWICLFLACLGSSWFSYQYFLMPHPASFAPDWQGAQWIHAADGDTPVAYFRYVTDLNVPPDGAWVTVAASQVFRLYVNGIFIGSNAVDFVKNGSPQAYMYDIASVLQLGPNVIGLRVANLDGHTPSVRASFGIVQGKSIYYHSSGNEWQATAQSSAVYPRYTTNVNLWATNKFDASSWLPASKLAGSPLSPMLTVNPLIYEQPIPTHWMSAGGGREAYFVRQLSLPAGITGAWLRLVAVGTANIFINGHLFMVWDGQAPVLQQNVEDYLSDDQMPIQYRSGLMLGVYDISSYFHPGVNTIAVHVTAPGVSAAQVGLDDLDAAMSIDMLINNPQNHTSWLTSNAGWHASSQPVEGWAQGNNAALAWPLPVSVGRPGASRTFYLPDSNTPRNVQLTPLSLACEIVLLSTGAVLGLWLLMSLFVLRRYYHSRRAALEAMSLAYLPAVAFEAPLVVLSREPQMPQPFPYTWLWGLVLVLLVLVGYMLLWLNLLFVRHEQSVAPPRTAHASQTRKEARLRADPSYSRGVPLRSPWSGVRAWLRVHWGLVLIVLLAMPLVGYNLPYEPYWQDELTSYFAAKGILAHGIPILPSGFLYPKGELYSYLLALVMAIFGDQDGIPRWISMVEYLLSLPLLYGIGCYFFNRRIALLATAMLALSPIALIWARQIRMYEQAQLMTILVVYVLYRAIHERERKHLVYLAVGCIILDYLSHEETFIILPAALILVLAAKLTEQGIQGNYVGVPLVATRPYISLFLQVLTRLKEKHWWYAAAIGGSIIALQLLVVHFSHPTILGTDQSQRPLIQLTTDNVPFYIYLLFFPKVLGHGTEPWITVNSLLATAGCIWAIRRRDKRASYCAWFLLISFLTLVLVFTLASDRYIVPLLPFYYLMGAYALLSGLRALWAFARSRIVSQNDLLLEARPHRCGAHRNVGTPLVGVRWGGVGLATALRTSALRTSSLTRIMAAFTVGLVLACVLILPMLPISSYNLFLSQQTGLAYHRHYADYDAVGQYMQHHWQKGDVVITVSPAISILYYVGHVNYFFSVDRALYLFERDGQIIDTPTSSTALLDQQDFQAVLATHARIWIISDNGLYQTEVTRNNRFVFPSDFHRVFEGYGSAIYFRGD